jgi:hypothetical protein
VIAVIAAISSLVIAAATFYLTFMRRPRLQYFGRTISSGQDLAWAYLHLEIRVINRGIKTGSIAGLSIEKMEDPIYKGIIRGLIVAQEVKVDGVKVDLKNSSIEIPGAATRILDCYFRASEPQPKGNFGSVDMAIRVSEGKRDGFGNLRFARKLRFKVHAPEMRVAWEGSDDYYWAAKKY